MKLVKFKTKDNTDIWINPETVATVEKSVLIDGAYTEITYEGGFRFVKGKPDAVVERLAGSKP